jgi:hypothetical protein
MPEHDEPDPRDEAAEDEADRLALDADDALSSIDQPPQGQPGHSHRDEGRNPSQAYEES